MRVRPPGPIRWERHTKPGGDPRWIARLAPEDEARYRRLVGPLVPRIERSLGPAVFANRSTSDVRLRSFVAARSAWRRAARRAIADTRDVAVVLSDVRDCYGSVGEPAIALLDPARELLAFLRLLATHGVRGLPIGPDPSAVLANGILAVADREVAATGCRLIRWVDDVVIVAAGHRRAVRALDAWRRGLADLDLEAHDAKTRLITDAREALSAIGSRPPSDAGPRDRGIIPGL